MRTCLTFNQVRLTFSHPFTWIFLPLISTKVNTRLIKGQSHETSDFLTIEKPEKNFRSSVLDRFEKGAQARVFCTKRTNLGGGLWN